MPHRPHALVALFALTVILILSGCGDEERSSVPTIGQPIRPGPPGALISHEELDATPPMRAWKIAYHSRSIDDDDISVSGLLAVPTVPPPDGGFPLVAWAHPTTGTADVCAPSLGGPSQIHLLEDFLAAGWAVAATDYEGLGSAGPHPYLVGVSEARAVLDSIRAARHVPGAHIEPTQPVALAGFSQGGHAALWAAEIAPSYSPELTLAGVAAAAPVTDVSAFADRAARMPEQFGVLATIAYGYSNAYSDLSAGEILTPAAMDLLDVAEERCIGEVVAVYSRPIEEMLARHPEAVPNWASRLEENLAASKRLGIPAMILQGDSDPIVYESVTRRAVERLCTSGDSVRYRVVEGADHAVLRAGELLPWIRGRFEGETAPSDC